MTGLPPPSFPSLPILLLLGVYLFRQGRLTTSTQLIPDHSPSPSWYLFPGTGGHCLPPDKTRRDRMEDACSLGRAATPTPQTVTPPHPYLTFPRDGGPPPSPGLPHPILPSCPCPPPFPDLGLPWAGHWHCLPPSSFPCPGGHDPPHLDRQTFGLVPYPLPHPHRQAWARRACSSLSRLPHYPRTRMDIPGCPHCALLGLDDEPLPALPHRLPIQ